MKQIVMTVLSLTLLLGTGSNMAFADHAGDEGGSYICGDYICRTPVRNTVIGAARIVRGTAIGAGRIVRGTAIGAARVVRGAAIGTGRIVRGTAIGAARVVGATGRFLFGRRCCF